MAEIKKELHSTLNMRKGSGMSAEESLCWLVFDFLNEEDIDFKGDDLFKDNELLPIFLDWLCESVDLREDDELVSIIERNSGYKYVIENGGNQAFI